MGGDLGSYLPMMIPGEVSRDDSPVRVLSGIKSIDIEFLTSSYFEPGVLDLRFSPDCPTMVP